MRLALLLLLPVFLFADGGQVILKDRDGGEIITVFADPAPVRAGQPTDLSVLVQNASTQEALLDGQVTLKFARHISVVATHRQATNKLLFAATVTLPRAGAWKLTAVYGKNEISGDVPVAPAESGVWHYWPFFAAVPVAVALFALNRHLEKKRQLLHKLN